MSQTKWSNKHYVTVYELARAGMTETQIADALGVSLATFTRWKAQKPALKDAWDRGAKKRNPGDEFSFRDYVFQRLPPKLRDLWVEINAIEFESNDIARVEALLERHGKRVRQHLFVYALTSSNFNVSKSLRRLNIPRKTFESWVAEEPDFAELMDEIHWHKENFFENALIGRVVAGDTPAIIHAAKTQLRGRGYNDRVDVNVHQDVNINISQRTVNVLELDLPIEIRKGLLTAMRAARATNVIEAGTTT